MLPRIQEILSAEDFRLNDHARVFTVLEGLRQQNAPIDYVTVADALGGRPEDFQLIAGILHGAVIEKNHCVYHAQIIRRKSQQRGGIHIAERMAIAFADPHCDPELAINQFIGELQALAVRI
jgi:replicative DNA helicase